MYLFIRQHIDLSSWHPQFFARELSGTGPDPRCTRRHMQRLFIRDASLLRIDHIAADRTTQETQATRNERPTPRTPGRTALDLTALPGAAHDLTETRPHGIVDALTAAGVPCWAANACQRADGPIRVPYQWQPSHPVSRRTTAPTPWQTSRTNPQTGDLLDEALAGRSTPAVFVGDSVSDLHAAKAAAVPFIGYANKLGKITSLARSAAVTTSMDCCLK
ncbi:beta-phosphoglucomutase-like phosphatase (HAD superfamily) [Actinokineospora baliensis]|uniref:hypothetical protein n=1 Tax=Actinokineospora baliensis TaxID=547056 RepID=UPI00195A48A5|nr:hypothetical protein [Actinokineospora baliensis]MBM7770420.1 beta-phosphoglucomutase-like phosphatase (HAD superfamily) [Actinokineospora baliensis]